MSTARVDFTLGAAERIANVVRSVERGSRNEAPLSFERPPEIQASRQVRICNWTGAWGINQTHVIEFQGSGGATSVGINRYFGFKPSTFPFSSEGEGIAVRGSGIFAGSWILSCFSLDRVDNYLEIVGSNETVQFLGHGGTDVAEEDGQLGPFLKWYSITTCEVSQ